MSALSVSCSIQSVLCRILEIDTESVHLLEADTHVVEFAAPLMRS